MPLRLLKMHPNLSGFSMSIAYSGIGDSKDTVLVYSKMLHQSISVGNFAFLPALKACSHLLEFFLLLEQLIDSQILKSKDNPEKVVNALPRLYAQCGTVEEAQQVFGEMGQRNIVSWNFLIAAFVCKDRPFESLHTFRRMQSEGIGFRCVVVTTIIHVCTRVTDLRCSQEIHAQMINSSAQPDASILNSLLDMYAKCGAVKYCQEVLRGMISRGGYAINGFMTEAIDFVDEMIEMGFKPDGVTFIALLSRFSHVGLMVKGHKFFERMERDYGVSPTIQHYASLVD